MDLDLVDEIYECAIRSDLWPKTLEKLSTIVSARGGVLFTARSKVFNWTASPGLDKVFERYFKEGWLTRCTRKTCLISRSSPGFITEHDLWEGKDFDDNPTYRDFLRPLGLGWSAGTAIRLPTGDDLVFSFEREYTKGPIERSGVDNLNELLPHLGRSAFVAARLHLERAKGAADALTALNLPAVVVDASGAIQAANALMAEVAGCNPIKQQARVTLFDGQAQKLLDEGLAGIETGDNGAPLSIPIRDPEGAPRTILHLVPIRRSARDVFDRSIALLVFTPVTHPKIVSIDLVRSLFDLTPSEARVARSLAGSQTVQKIAADSGISINTVRFHLRRVFEKTGCRRQSELLALLSCLTLQR